MAYDNIDKSVLGSLHIKANGGSGGGGCEQEGSDLICFMSVGASEESDVFTRCSPLSLLAFKKKQNKTGNVSL